jgi:hypothetical protein
MLCDLRVLKRFTPATQGEKSHFPKKNQGFIACVVPGFFRFKVSRGAVRAGNERGRTDGRGGAERRLDLNGHCHNMPA